MTGWQGARGRWVATAITAAVPLLFVMRTTLDATGKAIPAWKVFWGLFGASNQLLAALTLLGVTVWLVKTQKARWVWVVTGLPTVFMYVMSVWALILMIKGKVVDATGFHLPTDPVPWVALVLVVLAVLMLVEALRIFLNLRPPREPEPAVAPAG